MIGTVRAGKIEIRADAPLMEGTQVLVTIEDAKVGEPRLLQRGKYKYPDGLSTADFQEFRRQMNSEWEEEIDEFFPTRDSLALAGRRSNRPRCNSGDGEY